jgi:ribosomal protein S18 acetylase RimI-like enzyme
MTISFADRLTDLPIGFSARTPVRADIKACTQVVRDVDVACCGETTTTEIELEADLFSHSTHGAAGTAVIVQNRQVVGFINIFDELTDNRGVFYDIFISPSIEPETSTEISLLLIKHMENYSRELMHNYALSEAPIKTGVYDNDKALLAAIEKSKYEYHRTYWRMKIQFDSEIADPAFPSGYEITRYEDSEAALSEVHEVQKLSFADYYDFNPISFENWKKWYEEPMNDSSTWRLVRCNGELIGYIMGNKRFDEESFGYVASIGVLREHRGKGIARALLLDMFSRDRLRGMKGTLLHGDSSNPTGAMKLYASVGMHTDRVYLGYRKELKA